jgi:hypothetical protein
MVSGGITKAHPEKNFRFLVKEALDYARIDRVISHFSDHFTLQLKAGATARSGFLVRHTDYAAGE